MTEVIPPEVQLLTDLEQADDPRLRVRAASLLGELEPDRFVMCVVVPGLRRACGDEDEDAVVRRAATTALERIQEAWRGSSAVRARVLEREIRSGSMLDAHEAALIIDGLIDADVKVRRAAARAATSVHRRWLGTLTERIIECLADALRDDDPQVRKEAADALFNIAHRLREEQERVVSDPSLWTRLYSFVWSAETFRETAVPSLEMVSGDADGDVRAAVADALGSVPNWAPGRPQMLAALTRALQEKDVSVRLEAVGSLAQVATRCDAQERLVLVEALSRVLNDRNKEVRDRVAEVRKAIGQRGL